MSMLVKIRKFAAGIFPRQSILLGRWNTHDSETIKSRRAVLANIDSCGDELCSSPLKLKKKLGYYKYDVPSEADLNNETKSP